ncbi:MAG: threonine aldolase family protein [Minwuia sp.]|uniref:threonine aldolase family protein n=1 Tax=Minwuia sp. TaxID=2493630 RepID=UPI003A84A048
MQFASDNTAGVHPAILQALADANGGNVPSYGADEITKALEAKLRDIFETDLAVFPVATGSAANCLALSAMAPPWGAIFCYEHSHCFDDECCGPEFFTGGAKLYTVAHESGRITPEGLKEGLGRFTVGFDHNPQPAAVTLTQCTEWGTVYTPDRIAELSGLAHDMNCKVHMDGARFANALVSAGCSPAELTWKAGVDALSFGATKNGAMAAEAVIFFDTDLAKDFIYRRKRAGHLFSKMRFLSAQLLAFVTDDLWLENARHANRAATRLHDGLARINSVSFAHPVEANELFVNLPDGAGDKLRAEGAAFYDMAAVGPTGVRLVTSFATTDEEVDRFVDICVG